MNEEILRLFEKKPENIKPGIERLKKTLQYLRFSFAESEQYLVGGTNGKGSTVNFLKHFFTGEGYKVGTYTSPHISCFSERIQCSNKKLSLSYLMDELRLLQNTLPPSYYKSLSFFDVSTLLAMEVFRKEKCDVQLYEVGMGGRWDSTNCVDVPIAAITSIGKDHEQWLGHTFRQIAKEKLGITRKGSVLFWGEKQNKEKQIDTLLYEHVQENQIMLFEVGKHFGCLNKRQYFVSLFENVGTVNFEIPNELSGAPAVLRDNFALAAAFYFYVQVKIKQRTVSEVQEYLQKFTRGMADAQRKTLLPPGRYSKKEFIYKGRACSVLFDVGHNVEASLALVNTLKSDSWLKQEKIPGVVSILADKNVNAILDILKEVLEPLIIFKVQSPRSIVWEALADRHRDVLFCADVKEAWEHGFEISQLSPLCPQFVVCGSFLAVGEVFDFLSRSFHLEKYEHCSQRLLPNDKEKEASCHVVESATL